MLTYNNLFWSYRKDTSGNARLYLEGLLKKDLRKNAESIALAVAGAKPQNLQQFISDSKWKYKPVMDCTAQNVNDLLGDDSKAALLIDESGFRKKGKESVGVARQWLGCVGKVDNGQVGVFSALSNGTHTSLINARLYLPQEWIDDDERCEKAHIPQDARIFKTKDQIALEMVDEAIEQGMVFSHVGADGGYGKGLGFMLGVESRNKEFMVDIHVDQHVYTNSPEPYLPQRQSKRGRVPSEFISDEQAIRVDKLIEKVSDTKWKKIAVRNTTKGPLVYEVYCQRVFVWQPNMKDSSREWWLIVRRDAETKLDYKYSLSNAPVKTTIKELAFKQGQRFWVEYAFEVAKSNCGMDHYEVRGWDGWHRHMALSMMAQFFLLKEACLNEAEYPLLSPRDVMEILVMFLPQKERSIDQVLLEMKLRHEQRAKSKASATKKNQKKWDSILT